MNKVYKVNELIPFVTEKDMELLPTRKMFVWKDWHEYARTGEVARIYSDGGKCDVITPMFGDFEEYDHCAEIPAEENK